MRVFMLSILAAVMLTALGGGAGAQSVLIIIDKERQQMTVAVDGEREFVWKVSTGGFGYGTPSGTFRPFRMERDYFSREWDDAPMPHAIFFTARGHAIHGSPHVKSLGRRVSHGCVRLAPGNAAKLFALVRRVGMARTRVVVKGGYAFDWFD